MRDFSKVSPTVWRSKKFRSLSTMEAKHVYLYLLTCPHGNSAGCFDLHPMYACADLGMLEVQYLDCIRMLCSVGLIEWDADENTVLIGNWLEFNAPANAKHAAGILSQLDQASSDNLKAKAYHVLRADIIARKFDREVFVRNALQVFFERYGNGIPTETRDLDETETRPDETRPETREERSPRPAAALTGGGPTALEERPRSTTHPPPSNIEHLLKTKLMRQTA